MNLEFREEAGLYPDNLFKAVFKQIKEPAFTEEAFLKRLMPELFFKCCDELKDREKETLVLKYRYGYTHKQIGASLAVSQDPEHSSSHITGW